MASGSPGAELLKGFLLWHFLMEPVVIKSAMAI